MGRCSVRRICLIRARRRWVASRKLSVVRGVLYGLITQEEALRRYGLSEEEFREWVRAVSLHGEAALKVTALKTFRDGGGHKDE